MIFTPNHDPLGGSTHFFVIPLGVVDDVAVRVVAANIQAVFDVATDVEKKWPVPEAAHLPNRDQYHAAHLMKTLEALPQAKENEKRIGIIAQDITLPFLTYVFGEAQIGGTAAVISTYRLAKEKGGQPCSRDLLYSRLAKVGIHEAGHVIGLTHCSHPQCLMNFSIGLDALDQLTLKFCDQCVAYLENHA